MLSAYLVAAGMLVTCGLIALTLIKTVDSFDNDERGADPTDASTAIDRDAA